MFAIAFALISWKLLEQPVNSWKRLFPYPWARKPGAKAAPLPAGRAKAWPGPLPDGAVRDL